MKNYYQNPILSGSSTFEQRERLVEQGKKFGIFYPPKVGDIIRESFINGFSVITSVDKYSVTLAQYARRWNEKKSKFEYELWSNDKGRQIDCFYDDALHGTVQRFEMEDITPEIKEITMKILDDLIMKTHTNPVKDVPNAAEWCRLQKRRSELRYGEEWTKEDENKIMKAIYQ